MINDTTVYADWTKTSNGNWVGLQTSFGEVRVETVSGALALLNSQGQIITQSQGPFSSYQGATAPGNDTCAFVYQGYDQSGGTRVDKYPQGLKNTTQSTCCATCNSDAQCTFWVWGPQPDNTGADCWLMMNVQRRVSNPSRISGGWTTGGTPTVFLNLGHPASALLYGAGASQDSAGTLNHNSSSPYVDNTAFFTPYFYSSSGYSSLAVSPLLFEPSSPNAYPAAYAWNSASQLMQWTVSGSSVDLYLIPAADAYAAQAGYWSLTGAPRILPRYAFGFQASRWGWANVSYIQDMLQQFRSGAYPLDAWISDFEWFTARPDYSLPPQGAPDYTDFGYNNVTFANPVAQLTQYHNQLNMRFGGIRKPRLGNSDLLVMAANKGWLLPNQRNLNYSTAALRTWYQEQHAHYLNDGVDFWWNDEGETQYFTFYWWNQAQVEGLLEFNATKRYYAINRAFTPGIQRFGSVVWTGDQPVDWNALANHPGYLLNWVLAGAGFVTCDIGGFNGPNSPPDLLTRWYQLGVFLPVMRVHSTISDMPHFPFLYPEPYASIMRQALNLRYQMVPLLYSLAHAQFTLGRPIFRPMFFEFPNDTTAQTSTSQWLVGADILVAPVVSQSNNVNVYLPGALWFEFNSSVTHLGPTTLFLTNVPLSVTPVFVRGGSIVPLAPPLQFTDQLPGGALTVQVYAGADASFDLAEDDGESRLYESGDVASVRHTLFQWSDAKRTLSWSAAPGSFTDQHSFLLARAVVFFADGKAATSDVVNLKDAGSITV